jgi:toxin ParE1/3/4
VKRIAFTDLANDDLIDIWVNIAPDNELAADRLVDEIHEIARKLVAFPKMGRSAKVLRMGARMFPHGDFMIVYLEMTYGIAVLRVVHGARDLTALDFPPAPKE